MQGARRITWDRLIGVVSFFSFGSQESVLDSSTLIEAVEDGWWYSAVLPDSRLVLTYMTDADLYLSDRGQSANYLLRRLANTRHTRARASSYALESEPRIFAANSSRLDLAAGRDWLAVGDAAMAFDPLSGQGVYKALELAKRAAVTIQEHWTGNLSALRAYAVAVVRDFNHYLLGRSALYFLERRFPGSIFWQRRTFSQTAIERRANRLSA
jgi:2-polyprenyl-6-methoxyphenol hydroxylase-like FAD-dependent oxidoreductase